MVAFALPLALILISVAPVAAAAVVAVPALARDPAPSLDWEVVSRRPHDTSAYTQGLLLDEEGRMFESLGRTRASDVREVDPRSGAILRRQPLPDRLFGEGLALVGDELVQLTWQAGLALRWDADTFELRGLHRYEGEGWGLCHDGERLVMSDGSDELAFRDARTFEPLGSVRVTHDGAPLTDLNELECVGDAVWANVWKSDSIYRIEPADGRVSGVLDLAGVLEPHPAQVQAAAVLNGIAWDAQAETFLVTGKYWPELIEIRLGPEPGQER